MPNMTRVLPLLAGLLLVSTLASAEEAPDLLKNPGFEDPGGWVTGWSVENTSGNGEPYFYHLTAESHGHGDARPRTGAHAAEVYSSDRVTRLSQVVSLAPGRHRLSAYARNNGGSSEVPRLRLGLGDKSVSVPVMSDRYRLYYGDFTIEKAGDHLASFVSTTLGLAVDDLALAALPAGSAPEAPYLYFDLSPTSGERSAGKQYYIRGRRQWVNFTVSCTDPRRLGAPTLSVVSPPSVRVSGFNEVLLDRWRQPQVKDASVHTTSEQREGVEWRVATLPVPRFVNGADAPVSFGGFWVEVPSGKEARLVIRLGDHGKLELEETLSLLPVDPPARTATPKRFKMVAYAVQDWKQALPDRLQALPDQFLLMGFNVWSDYGLVPADAGPELRPEEQVQAKAWEKGVREFWPNFSSLLETSAGNHYVPAPDDPADPDRYVVSAGGQVNRNHYNLRYAAEGGKAWMQTAVAAYQRLLARPGEAHLPLRYGGFINDALEGMPLSYDSATLADFARVKGLDPNEVTVANLSGKLQAPWLSYNMGLYTEVVRRWAEALRQVEPKATLVNTLGSFGPGGSGSLPLGEQMAWAKHCDVTMPQWYGPMRFYGPYFSEELARGASERVYGKANGYADVIPLLNVSMGTGLEDPIALRFKVFDFLSSTPAVKGIGYYVASNAFADGRFMVGLSRVHTLLSDVEDYYAFGTRCDGAAAFQKGGGAADTMPGMDADGKAMRVRPEVRTSVRVHRLGRGGRVALVTVVSHCNQGVGEKGSLQIDWKQIPGGSRGKKIVDRLTGRVLPAGQPLPVDTTTSGNLALFEITGGS